MAIKTTVPDRGYKKRGKDYFPVICNILGILILLAVIFTILPLTVPRFLGYDIYNVVNESMVPEVPAGSVIYVESVNPDSIEEGDILAFYSEDTVVIHRVVENHSLEGEFITKGDADPDENLNTVPYWEVAGIVVRHYPVLGRLMLLYSSSIGKIYVLIFAACGVMFHLLAARLRDRRKEALLEQLEAAPQMMEDESGMMTVPSASPGYRKKPKKHPRRKSRRQSRWILRAMMIFLAGVFLFSAGGAVTILHQYRIGDELYGSIADQFTVPVQSQESGTGSEGETGIPEGVTETWGNGENTGNPGDRENRQDRSSSIQNNGVAGVDSYSSSQHQEQQEGADAVTLLKTDFTAPLRVDFDSLQAENQDVIGWIYCKDTMINYPVLQGQDNDFYLDHDFAGNYSVFGSIFQEADNRPEFQDANNILYGHHMRNGSMFAGLENWLNQSYYEHHPYMWLLTPQRDYRIDLVAGYITGATSETYRIFQYNNVDFSVYLKERIKQSNFHSYTSADPEGRYVVLSTCAFIFDDARYVLHGLMVPVNSAGGVPLD